MMIRGSVILNMSMACAGDADFDSDVRSCGHGMPQEVCTMSS